MSMDFKPVPPDGKVVDLRNAPAAKTPEQIEEEKKEKHERVRRNLRLIALAVAAYYFISAGYSWYEESQLEDAHIVAHVQNPLRDPQAFRDTFNQLLDQADTSLPLANANDTTEGFVAVLSTAIEIKGYAKPNSKELNSVQIQTRYPDAFPPESLKAFQTFVLACERMVNHNAQPDFADEVLRQIGLEPMLDANPDDKYFEAATVRSNYFEYTTTFTSGPIDELTLVATPRVNITTVTDESVSSTAPESLDESNVAETMAAHDLQDVERAAAAQVATERADAEPLREALEQEQLNDDVPQI